MTKNLQRSRADSELDSVAFVGIPSQTDYSKYSIWSRAILIKLHGFGLEIPEPYLLESLNFENS